MTMSERLILIRSSWNESQAVFARKLGLKQPVYARYETGDRSLPDDVKVKISQLGINLHWLLTGEGKMFREKEPAKEEEVEIPEETLQGMAMLDSMLEMLIKKGVINEKDIPPVLAGVQRGRITMSSATKEMLERELERAIENEAKFKAEKARIEAELRKFQDAEEARESTPDYASVVELPLYEIDINGHSHPPTFPIAMAGKVAAGTPIEMIGMGGGEKVHIETALLPADARECYAVRVEGTSMASAGIRDGDYALIRSASVPVDGQIMLAAHGSESTLKLVKETPEEERRFHLYYMDESGREVLAREDETDWRIIGSFVCTFMPQD